MILTASENKNGLLYKRVIWKNIETIFPVISIFYNINLFTFDIF